MPKRPERRTFEFVLAALSGDMYQWKPPYRQADGTPDPLGPDGARAGEFGPKVWSGHLTACQVQLDRTTISLTDVRVLVCQAPVDGVYDPVDILAADPADILYDSGVVTGPFAADGIVFEQAVAAPGAAWQGPLAIALVWNGTGSVTANGERVKVVLSMDEVQP